MCNNNAYFYCKKLRGEKILGISNRLDRYILITFKNCDYLTFKAVLHPVMPKNQNTGALILCVRERKEGSSMLHKVKYICKLY